MSDVTFGIKMSSEMKNELLELIKDSELTSKDFMGMLLEAYKLEKSREISNFDFSDVDELQRLLKRIQKLYLNLYDKAEGVLVEQKNLYESNMANHATIVEENLETVKNLEQQLLDKENIVNELNAKIVELSKELKKADQQCAKYKETTAEITTQLKKERLLSSKLEDEIIGLKKETTDTEQLQADLINSELNYKELQRKNEEQASDMWFVQRENEKLKDQLSSLQLQHKSEITNLTQQHELQAKNIMLEQKLEFNNRLELIREEHTIIVDELKKKINGYD